jgi:antitoxin (DNA-binding transcriptional repressor) of toxin-antitoxin stability system
VLVQDLIERNVSLAACSSSVGCFRQAVTAGTALETAAGTRSPGTKRRRNLPFTTSVGPRADRLGRCVALVTTSGYTCRVKAVGIKALKAHLSEYVRLVKAGETILVTERDDVVAELRPARRQPAELGALAARLEALSEGGEVTLRSVDTAGVELRPVTRLPSGSTADLLDALRGEGDRR